MSLALQRGLLRSLGVPRAEGRPEQELLADVALMTILADGMATDAELERGLRSFEAYAELQGVAEDWLRARAVLFRQEAPFFAEIREELAGELAQSSTRRLALNLAAKVTAGSRPLTSEEVAVLQALGEDFGLSEHEREVLIRPWSRGGGAGTAKGYQVCGFNDPAARPVLPLLDYIAHAPNRDQLALAVHKMHAARSAVSRHFEGAEIVAFGEALPVGPHALRIDAYITSHDRRIVLRFLAEGECMHPLERDLMELLVYRLEQDARLLVVPSGVLAPEDWLFVRDLSSPQIDVLTLA